MKINSTVGNVHISIDTSRIDENLQEAQKLLNEQIVADCDVLIPFNQGAIRSSVNYPQGVYGDEIEWNTPYAHYQYEGKLYLAANGSSWAEKYEKKYPTEQQLQYHTSGTTDEWVEVAKEQRLKDWLELVEKTVGRE